MTLGKLSKSPWLYVQKYRSRGVCKKKSNNTNTNTTNNTNKKEESGLDILGLEPSV